MTEEKRRPGLATGAAETSRGTAVNGDGTRVAVMALDVERRVCPHCRPAVGLCAPIRHDLQDLVTAIVSQRIEQSVDELEVAA